MCLGHWLSGHRLGRRGTSGVLAISLAAALLAGGGAAARAGLVIKPTFDSTITGDPNAAILETDINTAVGLLESLYSDPITVSIDFRYATTRPGGTPLGNLLAGSNYSVYSRSYDTYVTALKGDSKTANDATAVANLPPADSFPNSPTRIDVSSANGRAVGLNTPGIMDATGNTGTGGTFDGIVSINSNQPFQFSRAGGIAPNKYDVEQSIEHEIDEVLGLGSKLPTTTDFTGNEAVKPEDLFRYSAPGAISLSASGTDSSYFSIDGGKTKLVAFNQNSNGDYGDWGASPTPLVQLAFSFRGTQSDVSATSPEGIALDVIGYDLVAVPEPGTLTEAVGALATFGAVAAVRRIRRRSSRV